MENDNDFILKVYITSLESLTITINVHAIFILCYSQCEKKFKILNLSMT